MLRFQPGTLEQIRLLRVILLNYMFLWNFYVDRTWFKFSRYLNFKETFAVKFSSDKYFRGKKMFCAYIHVYVLRTL